MIARVIAGVWFASAFVLSVTGVFERVSPAVLLLGGLAGTVGGYLTLMRWSDAFRHLAGRISLRGATLVEAGRIVGGSYILLDPKLPDAFALLTGWSDVVVGVSAPLAARWLVTSGGEPKAGFALWHAHGLAWIVVSVVSGAWTSAAMNVFPLSLIPTFLGPMVILAHLVALGRSLPFAQNRATTLAHLNPH